MPKPRTFQADELIVNYHDACVYGRDLALVESSTAWLNDACIHFYFTWLQQQQRTSSDDAAGTTIQFLDPSVISFLMHQCHDEEDLQDFAIGNFPPQNNNNINAKSCLWMVPINDHFLATQDTWAIPGAGMHWSLLVLRFPVAATAKVQSLLAPPLAWHLDSASGNYSAAQKVAQRILSAWDLHCQKHDAGRQNSNETIQVGQCQVPKQQNGYDCGIHTLAAAEALSQVPPLSSKEEVEQAVQEFIQGRSNFCALFRSKMAQQIRQLGEESG